ncbi:MAG: DNA-processing protein DprA [Oleiphilaceae bacterium]|nr:DNA-processing protein DprA [Oleiphilaceae bacterium]
MHRDDTARRNRPGPDATTTTPPHRDPLPWLMLSLLPAMTPRLWAPLLDHWDCPTALLRQTVSTLRALALPADTVSAILAWQAGRLPATLREWLDHAHGCVQQQDVSLVTWQDADYPSLLRHIHDPPPVLYLRGQRQALAGPQLAIVGSRRASHDGLDNARRFARALSQSGYGIVSGLALGADGAAHKGALEGPGRTLAVLAAGVEPVYPPSHRRLAVEIARSGALISEMPPGTPNEAHRFPRRNRLISGLCQGVLVVEASTRSGSLITARLAMEQGREVFALPGSIHNPQARGCHQLLREGARLVESVPQILEELGAWQQPGAGDQMPASRVTQSDNDGQEDEAAQSGPVDERNAEDPALPGAAAPLSPDEAHLLGVMGYDPQSTDRLCERSGMSPEQLMQCLMGLEMAALIRATPGGYCRRFD